MTILQVTILAIIQGITEFLPVSSSGHLAIFQNILGFDKPVILFDILLHLGSLISILIFFRARIIKMFLGVLSKEKESLNYLCLVIIGTIPAVLAGLLFDKQIELTFTSLKNIGFFFLTTSVFLLSTKFIKSHPVKFNQLNWRDILFVGLFQAISILPGVSRSGFTISSALWRRFSPQEAFEFSFFLAIPAIIGAFVFKIKDITLYGSQDLIFGLIGMFVSVIVSYFSLGLLQRILKSANFFWFGIYCLIIGFLIIFL